MFYSNFVPKTHRFEILDFKKCCYLEIIKVIRTDTD